MEKEENLVAVKAKTLKEKPEKPKSTADMLFENFVSLQKIMADLAIKLSRVSDQLSKLLSLFEESAKGFKEGKAEGGLSKPSDELINKIDRLIEQNKTISRGLSLIGQASMTRESEETEEQTGKVKPKPLPEFRF